MKYLLMITVLGFSQDLFCSHADASYTEEMKTVTSPTEHGAAQAAGHPSEAIQAPALLAPPKAVKDPFEFDYSEPSRR